MFQLDNKFLEEVGLGGLPEDQKNEFIRHLYSELEGRVGTQLSENLSDEQLAEFEAIVDRKEEVIAPWINHFAPNYQQDEVFLRLKQAVVQSGNTNVTDVDIRNEYVATKWLEINRPDYRQVVAQVLASLKQEVIENRDAILGNNPA